MLYSSQPDAPYLAIFAPVPALCRGVFCFGCGIMRYREDESNGQQKIGTFLKQLRQEHQLTQENLAEIMCVTNRSVSRWENGVNLPDLPTLIQLADFYGVELRELLDGERKPDAMNTPETKSATEETAARLRTTAMT